MRSLRGICLLLCGLCVYGQRQSGELRLVVKDASGAALTASGVMTSQASQTSFPFVTDGQGRYTRTALPFGLYRLQVTHAGFAPFESLVEIRSEVPLAYPVTLAVSPIETQVLVSDAATLLDPRRTAAEQFVGAETIQKQRTALPGRSVLELVNTQPGWLLEANGILHPRGSEYQVQYLIDGLPLFENRSPAFAPILEADEFQSLRVITGGFAAEYGRKLGGVVEVTTPRETTPGWRGQVTLQGGSFATQRDAASLQYGFGQTTVGLTADGMTTDRYLDPPVQNNYTNHGSGGGIAVRLAHNWSAADRTQFYVTRRRTGFLVPNEMVQEAAGQRQDRTTEETFGQFSHEHVFSPRLLGAFRAKVRDASAALWSNTQSTPIQPGQNRSLRETYVSGSLAGQNGVHDWKVGAEGLFSSINEQLSFRIQAYRLNGVRIFDREVPATFQFADRAQGREPALFAQDLLRLGRLTISAGLRYDHYRLRADEGAFSPRLGVAWYVPSAGLVLRASYDRVFQTPAVENILLASDNLIDRLGGEGAFLPLRPSRGNYYEAGLSKSLFSRFRLDASAFRRDIDDFADDSVLLNTGVSFPIAFQHGRLYGFEGKLEMPRWGPLAGFASYGYLVGRGELPVAGGFFLGDEVADLVRGEGSFPISQDQRHTVRGQVRSRLGSRAWAAFAGRYDSGLPVELEGAAPTSLLVQQYGQRILDRVNLARGRVRPSSSLDISGGADLWQRERRAVRLQADVLNLSNRLNLINFSGLFSGTAIAPGRQWTLRLQTVF